MNIIITKEFMYKELRNLLKLLFALPELESIVIKEVVIQSVNDEKSINRAVDRSFYDIYSDVDIHIKIKLSEHEYKGNSSIYADCMSRLGFANDILGMSHYCTEPRGEVIRICKTNGMRFDLIITATYVEDTPLLPHIHISENCEKINNFWFVAVQALGKLMRKDYLISTHLAHMLIQEGIVLQMVMRDKEKNTSIHKFGYAEELDYLNIFNNEEVYFKKTSDETYNYISKLIYSAVKSYDRMVPLLNASYKSRIGNYLDIWSCYYQFHV